MHQQHQIGGLSGSAAVPVLANQLVEAAPDAIVAIDADGTIVLVNRQVEALFGYARDELVGQPVELLIPKPFRARHHGHRAAYQAAPRVRRMGEGQELFGRHKAGAEFPVEISLSPVDSDGQRLVIAAIRDVSERKRTEQEIRLLQEITLTISAAEDVDEGLGGAVERVCSASGWQFGQAWVPRADGRLELTAHWHAARPGLEVFRETSLRHSPLPATGLATHVLASRRPVWFPDIQHDQHFLRREAAVQAGLGSGLAVPVLAGEEVVAVLEFFETEPQPEDARLLGTAAAVAAQLGTLVRRIRAEDQLRQVADELARSNAELEQFASVVAHDLQEPLRMVASYTELLRRRYAGQLDQDADEFIGYAVDGATRMRALISGLLIYARVGTRPLQLKPVAADQVVDGVLADLAAAITDTGASVTRAPLPTVMADPVQLHQLFQNLIANALKFHGQAPPVVHISAAQVGEEWVFAVRDHGIGIESQHLERIFAIFQRLHTQEEYPGTGIGLAVCRKVVERLGGRIWVESAPGQGTIFRFTLPPGPRTQPT